MQDSQRDQLQTPARVWRRTAATACAAFNAPRALAFDAKGYLFVATTGNVIRKLQ